VALPGNELFSSAITGGGGTKIVDTVLWQNWQITPDGNKIVYFDNSNANLLCVTKTGGTPINLATDSQNSELLVTPDSNTVLYRNNSNVLRKVSITGGTATTLADNVYNYLQATPDYTKIVYYDNNEGNLRMVPISGDVSYKVADGYYAGVQQDNFKITPDGAAVVYLTWDMDGIGYLKSAPINGGTPFTLVSEVEASWYIYCITR
jgi:hypothetical protein